VHRELETIEKVSAGVKRYLYNGKELQQGTDWLDYGARQYDPQIGRWNVIDPMAEKYYSITPYAYCANNPIIYIDPNGMEIDQASQAEWDRQKKSVINQRDKLESKIGNLNTKAEKKGWSAEKLAGKIGNINERVSSLNGTISNLGSMEASKQVYSLQGGASEVGGTSYDSKSGNIVISYGSTSNFVHETTHIGQYASGDMAFDSKTGAAYAQDLGDEVGAYKAQFAYSPSSVSGLTSTSTANSFGSITTDWVKGITTSTGATPYAPGGFANTGQCPLNINSTKADFIRAYPNNPSVKSLPANFNLKALPNIIYNR
jgi:RHS repeat-associated protein